MRMKSFRSEIIFLITPTIVHDESLWEMGKDTLAYAEAVQVGSRAGLLPFSRTRITSNYNQLAIEAYNAGKKRKAAHYINNSLRLDPHQPEMIRLRQEVTGKPQTAYERSILEKVFRREFGPLVTDEDGEPQVKSDTTGPTAPAKASATKSTVSKSEQVTAPGNVPTKPAEGVVQSPATQPVKAEVVTVTDEPAQQVSSLPAQNATKSVPSSSFPTSGVTAVNVTPRISQPESPVELRFPVMMPFPFPWIVDSSWNDGSTEKMAVVEPGKN
jgi:hypothetical protein